MFTISSPAFGAGEKIPLRYSCQGEDINPPLEIKGTLEDAVSLVLIVDDPDAPAGTWIHWLVWNIDPQTIVIEENSVPSGAVQGTSGSGQISYEGPCPPSGIHRYFFRIYALDCQLDLPEGSDRKQLEAAMEGHVIDQGELMGSYEK